MVTARSACMRTRKTSIHAKPRRRTLMPFVLGGLWYALDPGVLSLVQTGAGSDRTRDPLCPRTCAHSFHLAPAGEPCSVVRALRRLPWILGGVTMGAVPTALQANRGKLARINLLVRRLPKTSPSPTRGQS